MALGRMDSTSSLLKLQVVSPTWTSANHSCARSALTLDYRKPVPTPHNARNASKRLPTPTRPYHHSPSLIKLGSWASCSR